jgi:hypothetical protein
MAALLGRPKHELTTMAFIESHDIEKPHLAGSRIYTWKVDL